MKRKKIINDIGTLTGLSIGLPIGAKIITKVGGDAAPITTISKRLPIAGKVMGAGFAVNLLKNLRASVSTKKRKNKII